ncbi:MAG: hypothetical protein QXZ61_00880 [Saccharolobus sp.]
MRLINFSLILTIIALTFGGFLLIGKVPLFLSIGTFSVVIILLVSLFIMDRYNVVKYVLFVLAIGAMISSSTSIAHIRALEEIGQSNYITILDILMILGFYVGPILYIVGLVKENFKKRKY